MIDVIRIGHAASPHGCWIAGWVKEQLLHENPTTEIILVPVTASLTDFAQANTIPKALSETDLVVVDGSFLPTMDTAGVVVAAVCERADPRHCIVGNGDAITVWHPCLAAVLHVTDPLVHVEIDPLLIDTLDGVEGLKQSASTSTMLPVHALSRVYGQKLGQTPVEAEDVLPICGQATVLVYTKEADKALGTMIFGELNAVDTRREVTVERYFKAQLDAAFHDSVCCYATGSDRFLYLFVTIAVGTTLYKTRSGAHITALNSIVEQAIDDLERQAGVKLRV